jgi:hypothetical protein
MGRHIGSTCLGLIASLACVGAALPQCFVGPELPLTPSIAPNGSATPRALVSAGELRELLREGGPVLALFLHRRCALSRAFWPSFAATAAAFPHLTAVAVDVELEFSLTAQFGIAGVPLVWLGWVAPTAGVPAGSTPALHTRALGVGVDGRAADARLASFVQMHTGHLPTRAQPSLDPALARPAGAPAAAAAAADAADAGSHSATATARPRRARSHVWADALEAFPEPSPIHWRLVLSALVGLGSAMQVCAQLAPPCAPRARELLASARRVASWCATFWRRFPQAGALRSA